MARQIRQADEPEDVMPTHLATFIPEQWADDEADDASELAQAYGKAMARRVMRSQRWRALRRRWEIEHGQGRWRPDHLRQPWLNEREEEWARRFPLPVVGDAKTPRPARTARTRT
jgi:hypothetical protein